MKDVTLQIIIMEILLIMDRAFMTLLLIISSLLTFQRKKIDTTPKLTSKTALPNQILMLTLRSHALLWQK